MLDILEEKEYLFNSSIVNMLMYLIITKCEIKRGFNVSEILSKPLYFIKITGSI